MFGYDNIGDMFDGGGAGRSGSTFSGGGPISSISNMVASPNGSRGSEGQMRPQGRPDMERMAAGQPAKPNLFQDMFNGGGMGATGDTFKGAGGYSGLLNMLGVNPIGAQDRGALSSYAQALQAASQPQVPSQAPYTAQPAPTGYGDAGMQQPNYADRFALPPQQPDYADRFALPPQQPAQYGSVGMPYPEWAQGQLPEWAQGQRPEWVQGQHLGRAQGQQYRGLADYLRPNGVSGY